MTGHRQLGKIVMVAAPQVWEYVPPLRRVVLPLTAVRSVRKMGGIEAIVWTLGGGYGRFRYWNYVGGFCWSVYIP